VGVPGVGELPLSTEERIQPSSAAISLKSNSMNEQRTAVCFRRVNLWEMAEFLKEQGIINAINLDGGGSATLVLNGTLASYPSEHW